MTTSSDIRIVGIETVVSSMYRAYSENVKIYFFNSDGSPFYLYNKTNKNVFRKWNRNR